MTIRFALALMLAAAPLSAHAGGEFALGITNPIEHEDPAGVATLAWVTDAVHPYELLVGHIESRHDDGVRISPTSTFFAASKRFTLKRWYVSSGLALADTNPGNRVLSGPLQFLTAVGWSAERWSISLRHISNAGFEGRNHGETFLVVAFHP